MTVRSEQSLVQAAAAIAGRSLGELAAGLGVDLPREPRAAKGWVGELLEALLGATAGNRPVPDFEVLGVELKSIPLDSRHQPKESTFVCSAPLNPPPGVYWETCAVRAKLGRVLWVPVEADPAIEFSLRRVGAGFLWSPSPAQLAILRADWEEHIELIALGRIDEIDARRGTYLQLRPKAMNSRERTAASDSDGRLARTNPRGFYLRSSFTREILADHRIASPA